MYVWKPCFFCFYQKCWLHSRKGKRKPKRAIHKPLIIYVHSFSFFIYLKVTCAVSLCLGAGYMYMFLVSSVVVKSITLLFIILFGSDLVCNVNWGGHLNPCESFWIINFYNTFWARVCNMSVILLCKIITCNTEREGYWLCIVSRTCDISNILYEQPTLYDPKLRKPKRMKLKVQLSYQGLRESWMWTT
jgi:hypothetical protein